MMSYLNAFDVSAPLDNVQISGSVFYLLYVLYDRLLKDDDDVTVPLLSACKGR
jgi:hypothetical protein